MKTVKLTHSLKKLPSTFFILFYLSGCQIISSPAVRHLERAEELTRQNDLDGAISEYQAHMTYRLSLEKRPNWENPYFYLLLVGDLKLKQAKPEEALKFYAEAQDKGIDKSLISDRYRMVGYWYEEQGDLQKALEFLERNKELDPMLFNPALDRIAKAIVEKEREINSKR